MTKINQFVDFLCGEAEFPFFKNLPEVPLPKIYQPEDPADRSIDSEIEAGLEEQHADGIHPDCDPDSPGINMIGDQKE